MVIIVKDTPVATTEIEKRVLGYIQEYEKKGYSDAKIRAALLKSNVSPEIISKCMRIAHPKVPLYRNPWFWVGIGIPLIILLILLLIYLAPHPQCSTDSDCPRGYSCIDQECVQNQEEPEIIQEEPVVIEEQGSVCGDGTCDTDEVCVPDCGCDTDLECEEYMGSIYYGCSFHACVLQGPAESSNTGGGGNDQGSSSTETTTTTALCVDEDCGAYVCETESACYGSCDPTGDESECAEGYGCGDWTNTCLAECTTDADCSSDAACDTTEGLCYSCSETDDGVDYVTDGTTLGVYLGEYGEYNDNCLSSTELFEYYCLTDGDVTTVDYVQNDCSDLIGRGYVCSEDVCAPAINCTVDTDCIEGYICDPSTNTCIEACTTDADCASGVCSDGACVECSEDADCDAGYSCTDNTCIADDPCDYLSSSSELLPPSTVVNPYVDFALHTDDIPSVSLQYYDFATSEQVLSVFSLDSGVWSESEIVRSSSGFYYSSLALGSDDLPRVVYQFDDTASPLYYASYDGSGWTVEGFADEGMFPIIEIDQNNFAHVLYADNTLGELVYAVETSTGWEKTALATIDTSTTELIYGWDMVLDSDGLPHVVYAIDDTSASTGVIYSRVYDGSTWSSAEEVVSGDAVMVLSLHMAFDKDGNPLLVYSHGPDFTLAYGSYEGSSWSVDDLAYTHAFFNSIALSPSGDPVLVSFDITTGDVNRFTLTDSSWSEESLFTRTASLPVLPVFAYDSEGNFDLVSYDYESTLSYVAYYQNSCYVGSLSEDCSSSLDEDGDGAIDCADSDCVGELGPSGELCEDPESTCDDGYDNDGDGYVDCLDESCDGIDNCEYGTEVSCTDGIDNDSDGATDCDDSDCADASGCAYPETTSGSTIQACKIIIDQDGNIIDGSQSPGTTFTLPWADESDQGAGAGDTPSDIVFTTPLTLNADLLSDDGGIGLDAECHYTDTDVLVGDYYYLQEEIDSSDSWLALYSDQYNVDFESVVDVYGYDTALYDGYSGNNSGRNRNADGDIHITATRMNRTVILVNQYLGPLCSGSLPSCADGVDNDGDGFADLEDTECITWSSDEMGLGCVLDADCDAGYSCDSLGSCVRICPDTLYDGSYTDSEIDLYSTSDLDHDSVMFCNDTDELCTDSDGGQTYDLYGFVEGYDIADGGYYGASTYTYDTCIDSTNAYATTGNVLREWYCPNEYTHSSVDYSCTCEDGACVQTPAVECNDGLDNEGDGYADYYGACTYAVDDGMGSTVFIFGSCSALGYRDVPSCETYCENSLSGMYTERDSGCANETDEQEQALNFGNLKGVIVKAELDYVNFPLYDGVTFSQDYLDDLRGILLPLVSTDFDNDINRWYDFTGVIIWESTTQELAVSDQALYDSLFTTYMGQSDTTLYGFVDFLAQSGYDAQTIVEILTYEHVPLLTTSEIVSQYYSGGAPPVGISSELAQGLYNSGYNSYGITLGLMEIGVDSTTMLTLLTSLGYDATTAQNTINALNNQAIVDEILSHHILYGLNRYDSANRFAESGVAASIITSEIQSRYGLSATDAQKVTDFARVEALGRDKTMIVSWTFDPSYLSASSPSSSKIYGYISTQKGLSTSQTVGEMWKLGWVSVGITESALEYTGSIKQATLDPIQFAQGLRGVGYNANAAVMAYIQISVPKNSMTSYLQQAGYTSEEIALGEEVLTDQSSLKRLVMTWKNMGIVSTDATTRLNAAGIGSTIRDAVIQYVYGASAGAPSLEETGSLQHFWRFIIDGYFAVHGRERFHYSAPALGDSVLDILRNYKN